MSLTKATYSMIQGAVINVLDYGAKGDGVTNDTAAIQAAFNAASLGNYVYFPSGTYLTSSTITFSCSFGGKFGIVADNPDFTPWNGAYIKYSGSGTCFEASEQLYGVTIENLGIELTASGLIGIDFKFGGNLNWVRKITINASNPTTPCDYGIYLRGINPDTNNPTYHLNYNKFEKITVYGNMLTGIKLGDEGNNDALANSNEINQFVEFLNPADPPSAKAIYLNGYGSTISQPSLSGNGASIRFYGQVGNNAICGGYFDSSIPMAIYVDALAGQRWVFHAFGCQGLTSAKITDTVEPSVTTRYSVVGEYTRLPSVFADNIYPITNGNNIAVSTGFTLAFLTFSPQIAASAPIKTIYLSSSDGILYFKDAAGVSHALY